MSYERLTIEDDRFLINRMIAQAPRHTLVREFFMNAQESAALAPEGTRLVRIYPTVVDDVRKLTFWNTGPGMGATELRTATNISASINKQMSVKGNFGIGAKVSGLAVSPAGIRYRSCKDGRVHEVTIGYDDEAETFVRFAFEIEGREESVFDVTDAVRGEVDLSFDWTEVVLMGEDDAHDTVAEPIGRGFRVDRSYVPTQVFRRFAEFRSGVRVTLDVSLTKGGGRDETGRTRTLKTLQDVVPLLPNAETVLCPETGLEIQYVHDPKHANYSHSLSALNNPATSSTTFCALVHKGERYDFRTGNKWSAVAPNYGIPFGSKVLTVEIYLPDDSALPNQYRDAITTVEERTVISTDDYAAKVRELMPEWVKDVIREAHPPRAQSLFINGLYSAVGRMGAELELHFSGQAEGEALRNLILKAAQRSMAFRVGKATCFAISKRLVDGWSLEDLDKATSPESLSLAADDYRQSMSTARKWIGAELKVQGFAAEEEPA